MSTGLSQEKIKGTMTGYLMVLVGLIAIAGGLWMFVTGATAILPFGARSVGGIALVIIGILVLAGLYMRSRTSARY
ncbi:MAG: hypothetical protein ACR2GP_11925 [Burkholderiaceae bacterium]